jgi:hypothetical protein
MLIGGLVGGCSDDATSPSGPNMTQSNIVPSLAPGVDPVTNAPVDPSQIEVMQTTASAAVAATTIDFEGLPFSTNLNGAPNNPASILTTQFQNLGVHFGKAGVSAGVAVSNETSFAPSSGVLSAMGLDAAGIIPSGPGDALGDIYFSFVVPGTTTPAQTDVVSFTIGDAGGDVDQFQIRSYDLGGALIDTQDVGNSSRFAVSISVVGIHRVEIDFLGDYGYSIDDLSFNEPTAPQYALDIHPTSCPNPVNVKSRGVTPVAILGSEDIDVQDIDVASLLLEGVPPIRHGYSDVATPFDGELCDCSEEGPDGWMDLTLKFSTQDFVAAIGWVEGPLEVTLTGVLLDGTPFAISDCILLKGLNHPPTIASEE